MRTAHLTLVCWVCGRSADIEAPPPQFAFEIAGYARDIEWIGVIDLERHRTLVLCGPECDAAAKRKDGRYRANPPKVGARGLGAVVTP